MRRGTHRRLEAVLHRLRPEDPESVGGGTEGVLQALETASTEAVDRLAASAVAAAQLAGALDNVEQGVVVCDPEGREVYRNGRAGRPEGSRIVDALAERAIAEALAEARAGAYPERTLELAAPSRRTLVIRAFALYPRRSEEANRSRRRAHPGANGAHPPAPAPDEDASEPIGAVAIVEDISNRRRLEEVRRDFVANVSHELKTPVGALRLLAETLDGEDDPEVVTRLSARVGAEAGRLGRIIDELLDLSRIEVNEAPDQERIPLRRVITEATQPLHGPARERQVRLVVEPVPGGLTVPGNRRDLVSAVSNLVDNAVKYSEPEGRVTVSVGSEDGWVDIIVADTGIGIPSRDLERIFERFYRVDRARSRSTGGTGLGLSIVRHIAVNHGGSVGVRSAEGEGSTFTLRLPVEPPVSVARGGGSVTHAAPVPGVANG